MTDGHYIMNIMTDGYNQVKGTTEVTGFILR